MSFYFGERSSIIQLMVLGILSMLIGELKMCRLGVVCGIVWSLRKGAV